MIDNNIHDNSVATKTSLPASARLPINRCNLPAVILGGLSFQQQPTALCLDGINESHASLFAALNTIQSHQQRAEYFMNYMTVQFRMHRLEDAGLMQGETNKRHKADYLRMLRGWLFDADSREAAVLKSWVESRFGLLTRYHKGALADFSGNNYQLYLHERAQGLYATNALEAQFDLLYSYCQYELGLTYSELQCIALYRGVNKIDSYEILARNGKRQATVLLNNLNSFTRNYERAGEFGDYIMETQAPWQKILFYSNLLPGIFSGEEEVLLIGGVYKVNISL
ncbi:NAD(+)--dinitrogen-reductase ADP-D-ribosyltransferase [hydrothermal vent metagenome]|uniref:NAD(+)--dinitrogen-reductase ADP-D-ribosyltransferase n=1 Tax=hydrothermal vent metagenome TaxID=652676 RepID=A0A3B1BZM0_9ZZZZ